MTIYLCLIYLSIYAKMQDFVDDYFFSCFTQKFKMTAKNGEKMIFGGKSPVDLADTLWIKNLVKNLSHTISEINAFLRFTQKFRMAAKWRENDFWEKLPVHSLDCGAKIVQIALSCTDSEILKIFHFQR